MFRFGWMVFQAAIAAPVYYFCAVILHGQGLAPAIIAMGFAAFVTLLITTSIDWLAARALRKRDQAQRDAWELTLRSPSGGSQQVDRPAIGQDIRKLI